jgi:hypothetical protein
MDWTSLFVACTVFLQLRALLPLEFGLANNLTLPSLFAPATGLRALGPRRPQGHLAWDGAVVFVAFRGMR